MVRWANVHTLSMRGCKTTHTHTYIFVYTGDMIWYNDGQISATEKNETKIKTERDRKA